MNFSSVILGEASGGDPPRPDPSADATALGTSSTTTSNDDEALPSRFGFLDVLDILRQYAVPSVDLRYPVGTTNENEVQDASATTSTLEQSANRAPTAFSHVLGGGYSAVVLRHATKEDVFAVTTEGDVIARQTPKLVAKSGTLVAFKKISPRPSENGINDTFRQSEAFRTICQEITVYRHPLLQRHENIGKLLYVAWQRLEVFPWIALELAAFGTLEDVLTAPGEGPTYQQKWNLTIDVALGVAAMHHVGIVHGDLKSANILVHHHPDRQIVGQVADFGGGVTVGQGTPIIGTPLWCAPEVLLAAPEIDRKLADTWSYGLIVASIWSHLPHPERAESSCFLDRLVSKHLEGGAREARTLLIKTEPDSSPNSLVSSCLGLSSCIVPLLLATLSCDCAQRTSIEALVDQDLAALCPEMIRKFGTDYSHDPLPQPLPFKVWEYGYRSREIEYQQMVYEHLTEAAKPLREAIELESKPPTESRENSDEEPPLHGTHHNGPSLYSEELSQALVCEIFVSAEAYSRRFPRQAVMAFQVVMSHCLQLGVQFNEDELVSWLYVAAKGGHPQALWFAPLLEASCANLSKDAYYRMMGLAIGACAGSTPSLVALKSADRTLYDSTRTAIRSRQRQDFAPGHLFTVFVDFMDAPRLDLSSCSLIEALKSQNVDRARSLLGDHSLDTSNMVDQRGRSVLHALTYLEDEDTEGLALLAYVHGAELQKVATLSEPTAIFLYRRGIEGTPIQWAATKGMVKLFGELLQLHEETGTVITDAFSMAMRTASLHHHDILSMFLVQREQSSEIFLDENPFGTDHLFIQALLGASLTLADTMPFSRRLLHGSATRIAKENTINLLLGKGGSPTDPCFGFEDFTELSGGHTAISLAISNDDDIALPLLVAQMRVPVANLDTLESLNGTLQLCAVENSLKCFKVVLDAFPQLINFSPTTERLSPTLTPLNMAARRPQRDYVLALLERGADTSVCHKSFSPLARAILDGHLETAEVIHNFCSDAERHQTFSYNVTTGFTLMGRVMSTWVVKGKSRSLIDAVKWIQAKGGAQFDCDNIDHAPVWDMILGRRASSSPEQAHLDDDMLATLFDMFPEMLDRPDPMGLFPLHRATMNGYRKAIELLLERKVNIDAECVEPSQGAGTTSFSLAAQRIERHSPSDISMGGKLEVRRWRERMKDILQYLLSRGATIGQHPTPNDFYRSLQYTVPRVSFTTPHNRDQDDELEWNKDIWPRKLPRDNTSSLENQRNGGELVPGHVKKAMQALAPRSMTEERKRLKDEEKVDFERYGQWLIHVAKVRRDQYRQYGINWHVASNAEEYDIVSLPDSWQRWHACILTPRSGEVDTGMNKEKEGEKDVKGKGKMPANTVYHEH